LKRKAQSGLSQDRKNLTDNQKLSKKPLKINMNSFWTDSYATYQEYGICPLIKQHSRLSRDSNEGNKTQP
jgi:hypothetical protein